jgi:hypothetical protein
MISESWLVTFRGNRLFSFEEKQSQGGLHILLAMYVVAGELIEGDKTFVIVNRCVVQLRVGLGDRRICRETPKTRCS